MRVEKLLKLQSTYIMMLTKETIRGGRKTKSNWCRLPLFLVYKKNMQWLLKQGVPSCVVCNYFQATESISSLADLYSSSLLAMAVLLSISAGSSSNIAPSCSFWTYITAQYCQLFICPAMPIFTSFGTLGNDNWPCQPFKCLN